MAPLVPRFHLFEIDDQSWFPPFLRALVQDALAVTWTTAIPFIQAASPAQLVARRLVRELGSKLPQYTFIDFCAGSGGPTPTIAKEVNAQLQRQGQGPVDFVLTDIHPNVPSWERYGEGNPSISWVAESVDASRAPAKVTQQNGKKLMRIFNLAFHHFDDPLAKDILKNTVETSEGFAIFELQDRSFASFLTTSMLPFGVMLLAPFYAWKWKSPAAFFFTWIIPILPFVLVFDGYISSLRTREPDEVEALLRSCGADASEWELKSGSDLHLWPVGYVNWIVCRPIERE